VVGFYERAADSAEESGGAPGPADDDEEGEDGERSPLPWQQSLPSAIVTVETGGK